MTLVHGMMLTYTRQQPVAGHNEAFTFWGAGSIGPIPTPFIITLIILIILYVILKYTQFGRNAFAAGGNKEAAYLAGINVERTRFFAFVISGFLAAIAGVLLASRLNSSTIQIGGDTALWAIAAAIMGGASMLGGKGNVWGTFVGVLALGILRNGSDLLGIQTYLQIGIKALILIGVVIIDAISIINVRKRLEAQSYGNRE
jgi:ribose transport system permease protein